MHKASAKKSLSIIIPAYNEEMGLEESYNEAVQAVQMLGLEYQIIIVDDCSFDNTPIIAERLSTNKHTQWIRNERNLNLGGSYRVGLARATCSHVTWVPGDANHPCADLIRVYKHLDAADILIAVPDNPYIRTPFRRFLSKCYTKLVNVISKNDIPYYNGLSVYKTDHLKNINLNSNSFSFQAEMLVKALMDGSSYKICLTSLAKPDGADSKALTAKNIFTTLNMFIMLFVLRFRLTGGPRPLDVK